jgi:hypothetical protein
MVLSGAKQRFANIRMICTHGGGTIPYVASRISILEPLFGAGPDRPVLSGEEVLEGLSTFYFDLTASSAAASLDAIGHLVSASRLMLGFDYPMMPASTIPGAWERLENYDRLNTRQSIPHRPRDGSESLAWSRQADRVAVSGAVKSRCRDGCLPRPRTRRANVCSGVNLQLVEQVVDPSTDGRRARGCREPRATDVDL